MKKFLTLICSSLLFSIFIGCITFPPKHDLRIDTECCINKPKKIHLTINNRKANFENKYQKIFLNTFQSSLVKEGIEIDFHGDNQDKNQTYDYRIDIPFDVNENYEETIEYIGRYHKFLKIPLVRAGLIHKNLTNNKADFSIFKPFLSDYRLVEKRSYKIQDSESLTIKASFILSKIFINLFKPSSELNGMWIDPITGLIYKISNSGNIQLGTLVQTEETKIKLDKGINLIGFEIESADAKNQNSKKSNGIKIVNGPHFNTPRRDNETFLRLGNLLIIGDTDPGSDRKYDSYYPNVYLLKIE
jgi:hypothetical protein